MATSLNATLNVSLNPQSLNSSAKQVQQALGRITGQASEFQKSLDASTARVFAFGATTAVLNGVTQSFKKLVASTIEVEKRLIEINSIFQASDATFNRFRNSIFKVAKETGQSFATVADGAAELARQGLSAEETAKRLKASLVLTRISGLDAEKSVKALTAAINGFASAGLNANQIVNKLVAVDTAFAVSAQDLAEAFSRAGSTAEDAGVSFDQLLGLVTAVEQKTARGGAVIGNAFKSIFTRISRGSTIEKLKELGVEIDSTQTGIQKLNALSVALKNVSDPTIASQIKELAGGVFQINVVSAALKDLGSDTSIFASAARTASQATNEAFQKNAELSKSISSQINALVQGLTSLSEKIGTITFGPLLENLIGLASKFTEFLDKALDPEKGNVFIKGLFKAIGSFLSGPAVIIFTAAFIKIFKLVARFAGEGLKALFSIGTQTERIKSIEGGIVGLLQRDENLRNAIANSTITQAQKEQLVLNAIKSENKLLERQAILMRTIATSAAAKGVSGFNPMTGSFKGKRGKGFSSGFMEEEAMAKMLGAPDNVQAHFGKGTINGSRFVMNDRELEIPHFAGGNSAVIPMYAGGHMPKYAGSTGRLPLGQRTDITTREQAIAKNYSPAQASSRFGPAKKVDKAKQMEDVIEVNPSESAMLVPNIGLTSRIPKGTAGRFKFKGKTMGFEYGAGLGVYGPKVPETVDGAANPQDERLRKNITKGVSTSAANFAGSLNPILGKPKPSQIRKMLQRQGGGKGALRGVVGAAFEAAVNVGLGISPARKVDGGDFDIKGASGEKRKDVNTMFGVKNQATNLYDYKENAGRGSYSSYAKKLANQGKYKTVRRQKRTGKSFAGGYMPKFAKGSPRPLRSFAPTKSVTKSGSGSGSGGGGGDGKDPSAPLQAGGGVFMGLFALQGILETVSGSYGKNGEALDANTSDQIESLKQSKRSYAEIKAGIKILEKENKEKRESKSALASLAQGASVAANVLLTFQSLSMVTGGKAGAAAKYLVGGAVGGGVGGGVSAGAASKFADRLGKGSQIRDYKNLRKHGKVTSGMSMKDAARGARGNVVAKRLGAVGAVGVGVAQAGSAAFNDDLEQGQKDQRYLEAGGATAGALIGGIVGSVVPIIGTAVGGAFGAWVGGKLGDSEGEDERVKLRKQASSSEARDAGILDFDAGTFNQSVKENLDYVKENDGFAAAVGLENAYYSALAAKTEILEKGKRGEEVSQRESEIAQHNLNQAAMRVAGVRFLTEDQEIANRKEIHKVNSLIGKASYKLMKAREAVAEGELVGDRIKKDQTQGKLRTQLSGSVSGPFAGAVGLASEQNLMFRDINAARNDKSLAQKEFDKADKVGSGASDEELIKLKDALSSAGENFEATVNKAAISFKNKIVSLEKGILEIDKQKAALKDKEVQASEDFIQKVVAKGKGGGDLNLLMDSMTNLQAFAKKIESRENTAKRQGKTFEMTGEETRQLAQLQGAVQQGGENAGFTKDFTAIVKIFDQRLSQKLAGEGGMGAKARALALVGTPEQRAEANKRAKKGGFKGNAIDELLKGEGMNQDEAIAELTKTQQDLRLQLEITRQNYKKLEDEGDTAGLAENINSLLNEMNDAATNVANLNKFSAKITQTVVDTNGLIEANAEFVSTQKALITKLTKELASLKEKVGQLTDGETDLE